MSRNIKAVLVGCGDISKRWVLAATEIEGLEIAGFVDLNEDTARIRAQETGKKDSIISRNIEEVLSRVKPDIVFNCTVPEAHFEVTLAALRHGAHILGEKPLADSLDNAREMVKAAQQSDRLFAVMQNRRYDRNIRRLRELVVNGQIGILTMLNSDFFIGAHFGGFRDSMAHVLLVDMAIHTFDAARLICGADPVSVYCKEWNPIGSWYGADSAAICIFEMNNGVVYSYRGSWCAEGLRTTWESEWRVVGQRGSVLWYGDERMAAQIVSGTEGFLRPLEDIEIPSGLATDKASGHSSCIREFVEAVRNGGTPETIATDNIKSLAMVFAAIESSQTGQRVPVRW